MQKKFAQIIFHHLRNINLDKNELKYIRTHTNQQPIRLLKILTSIIDKFPYETKNIVSMHRITGSSCTHVQIVTFE